MRFPQVGDRVKEAPAHALRAMFAGIGQMLLVADRMRSRPADPETDRPAGAENLTRANQPSAAGQLRFPLLPAASNDESRWRSLDKTGNVRILPVEYQASQPVGPAAVKTEPTEPVPAELTAEPGITEPGTTQPGITEPEITEPEITEPAPAELTIAGSRTTEPEPTDPVPAGPPLGRAAPGRAARRRVSLSRHPGARRAAGSQLRRPLPRVAPGPPPQSRLCSDPPAARL